MFEFLISIKPLGLMYGSAGGFLSPENLVGRSRAKFPPDASTLSGLFFSANKVQKFAEHETLRDTLHVAGPFWTNDNLIRLRQTFYLPVPRTKIIGDKGIDEWKLSGDRWQRDPDKLDLEAEYTWQQVTAWNGTAEQLKKRGAIAKTPWEFISILHPKIRAEERHVEAKDGLFLEYAVQMAEEDRIAYLSTHELPAGWYRFGGENHVVEVESYKLAENHPILAQLRKPIGRSFALISPALWGSNRLSYRYPQHPDFPEPEYILSDRALPYRYRVAKRMDRGRYAVSPGSVYVLKNPLNKPWWEWPEDWFPKAGFSLKKMGCSLCLPLDIDGLENIQGVA